MIRQFSVVLVSVAIRNPTPLNFLRGRVRECFSLPSLTGYPYPTAGALLCRLSSGRSEGQSLQGEILKPEAFRSRKGVELRV